MNQDADLNPIESIEEAAARRDAEIIAELDAQQASRSAANGNNAIPLMGLGVVTALALPLLLMATMRGSLSFTTAPQSATPAAATGTAPVANYISWNYSFEAAQQQASASNKLMMVEFYTDWCGVCKNMDAQTYPDPAVITETQNVVPVKINAESRTDLAQRYNVHAYPTFVWMDNAGNERYRVAGGFSAPQFVSLMQQNR